MAIKTVSVLAVGLFNAFGTGTVQRLMLANPVASRLFAAHGGEELDRAAGHQRGEAEFPQAPKFSNLPPSVTTTFPHLSQQAKMVEGKPHKNHETLQGMLSEQSLPWP